LCCFKSWWIELRVSLAAPYYVPVVLEFVGSVILLTSGSVSSIGESQMTLFSAIVTLEGDARVHVHSPDDSNESAKIKRVIN